MGGDDSVTFFVRKALRSEPNAVLCAGQISSALSSRKAA